jgi:uroporphyrinogen decarboxylase
MGVNLFNMGIDIDLNELRNLTGDGITLMGNLPPRDVLAAGTPEQVRLAIRQMVSGWTDSRQILVSCGGGMPPGVSTENIRAFQEGVTRDT